MTMAQVLVDIGFSAPSTGDYLHLDDAVRGLLDTATLAPDDLMADVSRYVVSVTTRRGATRADGPTLRYEGGTATIKLRNEDRRFDPSNLDGPYVVSGVTQIEPMRVVRVRAVWDGVAYPLWWGYSADWQVAYDGPNSSYVILTCTDAFSVFAAYDRNESSAVGGGEDSGARIHRILDSIDWPDTDRMIDTGDSDLQSTTLADNTLSELMLTADSELGELWMDADGRVTFRRRSAIWADLRSIRPNATFGDIDTTDRTATTINLAMNPSLETDTASGWGTVGSVPPTTVRSTTQALFGNWSLRATWGAGGILPGVSYTVTGLTPGRTYTISVYVYVPAGSPHIDLIALSQWGGSSRGHVDQWVRLVWTGTATATSIGIGIWPASLPVGGEEVYIDGLQVEVGATATAYTDGDQVDSEWDATAHASTSRRLPELPYADVTLDGSVQSIHNLLSIARAGGTAQVVEDSGSREAYLTRTHQRHDLLLQTDAEALSYAQTLLHIAARPEQRVAELVLRPRRDPDRLYPQALGREIGDRARVVRRPPGGGDPMEREVFVRGIEHEITAEQQWTTRFVLQSATKYGFIILDHPVMGVLNQNALAGF